MLPKEFTFDIYPFVVAIGVVIALFIFDRYFKKKNIKKGMSTDYEILFTISAGIGFIFAILFQNLYDFIENPSTYKWTWAMTFFGGLVGGVFTFFIGYFIFFKKKYPYSMSVVTTIAGGCIPLAHSVGRFACTLDGCCYGSIIDPSSPFYWIGIEFRTTPGVKVWPTQLMEAIFLLILSIILIIIAFKKDTLLTMPIYCISYGIFRFLIEFLRGDHRGSFIPNISPSQFWAIVIFTFGLGYMTYLLVKKKIHISDFPLQLETKEVQKSESNN